MKSRLCNECCALSYLSVASRKTSFASRLVMADVDIRTIAELMGHQSIQMTMRYAHLAPEHKLVAVERLARYNS
jgi:site-specific recombinase XerD